MGNGSAWLAGPIVVGIIAVVAISYSIYSCVRRKRMRQTLKTQVANQKTIGFIGPPALPPAPSWNNNYQNNMSPFQPSLIHNNMKVNQNMPMNLGAAIEMGANQTTRGFNYGNPLQIYDPLNPIQNSTSMGIGNALVSNF